MRVADVNMTVNPLPATLDDWCLRLFASALPEDDFVRGDTTGDGAVALNDAIVLLSFLFAASPGPQCQDAADSNDNGALALNDVVLMLSYLFNNGAPTAPPGPLSCGPDVGVDLLPVCVYTCP